MNILIASHHYPPKFRGGAEWRAHRIAKGLQSKGYNVAVVCVDSITDGDGTTINHKVEIYEGIHVHRLHFNLGRSPHPFQYSFRNPLIGHYIGKLILEFKPDILHLFSGYLISGSPVEMAKASGIPVVLSLTDFWFLCPRITLVRSDGSLCDYPRDSLDCVLCLKKEKRRYRLPDLWSRGAAGRIFSSFWKRRKDVLFKGMNERRSYLLGLVNDIDVAVSPSLFLRSLFESQGMIPKNLLHLRQGVVTQSSEKESLTNGNNYLRFGYVGQITKHKGVDVLINAFKRLKPGRKSPHLKIFGDMQQFPSYTRQLYRLKGRQDDIDFAGPFEHSRWKQAYSEIDILVVPSLFYDNSPNVIHEAFAAGKPVIASNLGGIPELVKHDENGFLFESGDVRDLALQMQKVIDQPDIIDSLKKGIRPFKTFQEELSELIDIYDDLLTK